MKKVFLLLFLIVGFLGMSTNNNCKVEFEGVLIKENSVKLADLLNCKKIVIVCDNQSRSSVEYYEIEVWIAGKGKLIENCNSSNFSTKLIEQLHSGDRIRIKSARVKSRPKESFNSGIYSIQ